MQCRQCLRQHETRFVDCQYSRSRADVEQEFAISFFSGLFPLSPVDPHDSVRRTADFSMFLCMQSLIERAKGLLANAPESSQVLRRTCQELIDSLVRAQKVRIYALSQ